MRNFLNLKDPEDFWKTVRKNINTKPKSSVTVNYQSSVGRILAESIKSTENLPNFSRSTVDGYAVKSKDIQGVSESLPAYLDLIGSVEMGVETDIDIKEGQTVYIPTGGMLPEGADCVVMVEQSEKISDNMIEIYKSAGVGENIIKKGEEVKKGELLFEKGHRIRPRDMGVFAGLGITEFKVYEKPRVAVISTGDELITPGEEMQFGQIRDINTYTISSLLKSIDIEIVIAGIIEDTYQKIRDSIKEYLDCDLILVSGGSSAGLKDVTVDVINDLGKPGVLIHGLKVKPGKPTILGQIDDTPIMGLPGHPGSAWMITYKFVLPLVKLISGEYEEKKLNEQIKNEKIIKKAVLKRNISSDKGREEAVLVKLDRGDNIIYADPLLTKSSFMRMFIEANGYLEIKSESEGLEKASEVDIYLF